MTEGVYRRKPKETVVGISKRSALKKMGEMHAPKEDSSTEK